MAKQGLYFDYDLQAGMNIKQGNPCVVCGEELSGHTRWCDAHGEGECMTCGTPYQIFQYVNNNRIDAPPKINVKDEFIPYLQQYWNETHRPMYLGSYFGGNPSPEDHEAFRTWLDEHYKPTEGGNE